MSFFQAKKLRTGLNQSLATFGAVGAAAWFAFRAIPASEVRRQRLTCIAKVVASQYLSTLQGAERGKPTYSEKAAFLSALNSVPAFFGADCFVMEKLRDFYRLDGSKKNGALMPPVHEIARVADPPLDHVEDNDLLLPFPI